MKNSRFSGAVAVALTPRRVFRTGIVLIVVSLALQAGLIQLLFAIGGQELAANGVAWAVVEVSWTLLLPLGAGLTVLSLIGRALEREPVAMIDPDDSALPRPISPRAAFWLGLSMVTIGLLLEMALPEWQMADVSPNSLLPCVLAYAVTPLAVAFVPTGILLIPAAWVLSMIEASRVAAARTD